jgi:hypothetical protein
MQTVFKSTADLRTFLKAASQEEKDRCYSKLHALLEDGKCIYIALQGMIESENDSDIESNIARVNVDPRIQTKFKTALHHFHLVYKSLSGIDEKADEKNKALNYAKQLAHLVGEDWRNLSAGFEQDLLETDIPVLNDLSHNRPRP